MGWDFFVAPLCPFFPFSHFFKSETWGKAWRFAHTESSGDLFMKMLHTSEKELTFGPGTCLLPTWWKLRQIIMLKNHGLHIASSVCFDFKEAQVSGDSFLGVCMDTSDQITSMYQWHSRVGHAAGRAPGQRLVFPVAVASESSMPGSDWTVELRAGTCIWSLFWGTSIALSDVQSVGRRKNPVSHTKEMKSRAKAERKENVCTRKEERTDGCL